MEFGEQDVDEWYAWNEESADEFPELVDAVKRFKPDERHVAGRDAAQWLKGAAMREQACVTRLLVRNGEVAAFYAIASAQIAISRPKELVRLKVISSGGTRVPCSHLEWVARAADQRGVIERTLLHAASVARDVATLQGNLVLSLDPYNKEVARVWREKYGFRKSRTEIADGLYRMYVPLVGWGSLGGR